MERQAWRERCNPVVREISEGSATRLSRSLPGALAVPQSPSSRMRCWITQSARNSVYPRELHAYMAEDGGTCRTRPSPPYWHIQYDNPEDGDAAARRAD